MLRTMFGLFTGGLIGKLMGFVRELMVAAAYGTGPIASSYRLAQSAILIPVNFFTTDILNAAIIPLQKKYRLQAREEELRFVWMALIFFGAVGVLIALTIFTFASPIVGMLAPGFDLPAHSQAVRFVKILAAAVPLYVVGNLLAYVELGNGHVKLTSLRGTVQSVGLIAGTAVAHWFGRPDWLAWGFVVAYIGFCCWAVAILRARGYFSKISISYRHLTSVGRDVWVIMRALMFLPILMQGNAVVEKIVASKIGGGAVAAVDYARLISDTGNILLIVPFSLAILGTLSGASTDVIKKELRTSVPVVMMISIPVSAFLCAHSTQVIRAFYQRGAFDEHSVQITSQILMTMGAGFWAQALSYIFQKALNAQMRNGRVVGFIAIALICSMSVTWFGYSYFGPSILGFAVAVYGVVGSVLGAYSLGFKMSDFGDVYRLLVGAALYVVPVLYYSRLTVHWNLIWAVLISGIFWVLWFMINPSLRYSFISGLKVVFKKLRRKRGGV